MESDCTSYPFWRSQLQPSLHQYHTSCMFWWTSYKFSIIENFMLLLVIYTPLYRPPWSCCTCTVTTRTPFWYPEIWYLSEFLFFFLFHLGHQFIKIAKNFKDIFFVPLVHLYSLCQLDDSNTAIYSWWGKMHSWMRGYWHAIWLTEANMNWSHKYYYNGGIIVTRAH